MIKKYSLKILQQAMNLAMGLDETMPDKLQALADKVIEMRIMPLQVNFFMAFQNGEVVLFEHYAASPDTIIESSPLGLIRLSILPVSKARSLFHDEVKLSGDVELGQQVKKLFDGMDIDWEGHLAHFTGDVVAHQVGSLFRRGQAFQRQIKQSFCQNMTEYLQEESRTLPPNEELHDFFDEIDTLSNDTERMAAKLQLLLAAHGIFE